MMTEKEMLELARKSFTAASLIDTAEIPFNPDFRMFCEENVCGHYGNNYGCPPDCGTPAEMKEKATRYKRAIVFQTLMEIDDPDDKELTNALKKEHGRLSKEIISEFKKEGLTGASVLPGPCSFCKTCKKLSGEPCVLGEDHSSCLSAYCMNVEKLAEACHMQFDWSGRMISYISLFLYNL